MLRQGLCRALSPPPPPHPHPPHTPATPRSLHSPRHPHQPEHSVVIDKVKGTLAAGFVVSQVELRPAGSRAINCRLLCTPSRSAWSRQAAG